MPLPGRNLRALVLAGAVALGAGTACGSGDDGAGDETAPASDVAARSTFADVSALAAALTDAGLPCQLEYEGLTDAGKQLSLCTLEGEQATLSVWFEPDRLDEFLATEDPSAVGATAVGGNWTVDVTSPELAERVAATLGGTVKR